MKVWLKYLIGIALGAALYYLFPTADGVPDFIMTLIINIGRYAILPVLFFSTAVSFYTLRVEKILLKTALWTAGIIVATTAFFALLGTAVPLVVHLPRISVSAEAGDGVARLEWRWLLESLFPASPFETLLQGSYILPCFVFAGLTGAAAAGVASESRRAVLLFDSLSKVFYNVLGFLTEVFSVGMIAVMFRWTADTVVTLRVASYVPLIITLLSELTFTALVAYPLAIRLIFRDRTPYKVLYASLCPLLAAFFCADSNIALALEIRHTNESLGVRRRTNAFSLPLFSALGRGGAALVSATAFIVLLQSYSRIEIPFREVLWIFALSGALSFALAGIPSGGAFFALCTMCSLYGRTLETSYLLIRDAAPILCSFATAFDSLTAMFGTYAVAVKTNTAQPRELRKFI